MSTSTKSTAPAVSDKNRLHGGSHGARVGVLVLSLLASMLVVGIVGTGPAQAAVPETPEQSWRVNGRVYATLIVGNTVFVGGQFSSAVSPSGQNVSRRNLAAFRMSDGSLITSWRADAPGSSVRALASDGSSLWLGGWFSSVNGVGRSRLAKVSVATGAVDAGFNARLNGGVRGIAVDGGFVYVGGHFTSADGNGASRLAKLDDGSGALVGAFDASANNNVFSVKKSPVADVLYVGGAFTSLNGTAREGIGAVSTNSGAVSGPAMQYAYGPALAVDVSDDGSRVYAATRSNAAISWRTDNGNRMWRHRAEGDMQAINFSQGEVYFGFHEGFEGDFTVRVLVADAMSGALNNDFRPNINRFWGVFAIDSSPLGLVIGGDLDRVEGVRAEGWARFPLNGVTPPTADFEVSVNGQTATLDASASDDPDGTIVAYEWDFGDGTQGTGEVVTHDYADGTWTAELTVRDDDGAESTTTRPVVVGDLVTSVIVPEGSDWRWRYDHTTFDPSWNQPGFDASSWNLGNGVLGFGGPVATDIDTFATSQERPLAAYFTRTFQIADAAAVTELVLETRGDDGVIVYVNGTEVGRQNMRPGPPTLSGRNAYADSSRSTAVAVANPLVIQVPVGLLVDGANVVSAQTHVNYRGTSDLSFELQATVTQQE